MRTKVLAPEFLKDNYLSTELRVPVNLLGINACSPLATNAIRDNIWDNFSSESYKQLPSVGTMKIRNPAHRCRGADYPLPAGGRGYIRPASLVSLWSTAPFLQNNTVGPCFDVMSRRSNHRECKVVPGVHRADALARESGARRQAVRDGGPRHRVSSIGSRWTAISKSRRAICPTCCSRCIGFFPAATAPTSRSVRFRKGMPVGLITNMDLMGADLTPEERKAHPRVCSKLFKRDEGGAEAEPRPRSAARTSQNTMLSVSKCRDLVVNKGHYFGTSYFAEEPGLSDDDKKALIEFLKTF